jgi:ATP-dependent DNA helicase RecG
MGLKTGQKAGQKLGEKSEFKPGLKLDTQIQFLKGVGPKLGDVLSRKDIKTVQDLIEYYPRAYEDRRAARTISSLKPNELVSLKAQVASVSSYNMGKSRRKIYDVTLTDGSGKIHCKYFRVPYRGYFERFRVGETVRIVGKVTFYRSVLEFHHPDLEEIRPEEDEIKDQILPIYPETEGLSTRQIQKMLLQVISTFDKEKPDEIERIPKWIEEKYQLVQRWTALKNIHIPPADLAENKGGEFVELKSQFHRRIIFEEFFWLELYLASKRSTFKDMSASPLPSDFEMVTKLVHSLSFKLTQAQRRCFKEIADDLAKASPMHRLVQGDVGSGKTLVALMSALLAIQNKKQAAIMVPTEILAEQHFLNSKKLLEPLGVRVALLTGAMKAQEKAKVYEALKNGEIDFCIGTHALIQEGVEFKDLALAIIDEQHRFGVEQRANLKSKGKSPHFLIMTATPIPRTLAMTVYGDLDVSIIDELPLGRTPIVTRVAYDSTRPKVMSFLKEQILAGRQAYIVYPLVEESEKIDLKDAISQFERLKIEFPDFKIALLHGKMKSQEKEDVMRAFRKGDFQILVSTTVIEVGVDVPNSTLMIIEHAERFGLSQLHQLRGRVGRGTEKSFCILFLGKAVSIESRERVKIMELTSDGFKISEADLEIRGPGEFLGRRQSGLPGFKLANLIRDIKILSEAREAAFSLLEKDPKLIKSEHQAMKLELTRTGGSLSTVG